MSEDLALCPRCVKTTQHALTNIGANYADLDRIATHGVRRRGSAVSDPTWTRVSAVRIDPITAADHTATNTLTTWARALVDDRPGITAPPITVPELVTWLTDHLGSVTTLPWAGDLSRELLALERALKQVTQRARTGNYLGRCGGRQGEGPPCDQPLYAGHEQRTIVCRCGATWDARSRRQQLVRAAEEELLPATSIARLAAVFTGEVNVGRMEERIRKWTQRGRVEAVATHTIDGRPRRVYRVGDVLDLLTEDTPKSATG